MKCIPSISAGMNLFHATISSTPATVTLSDVIDDSAESHGNLSNGLEWCSNVTTNSLLLVYRPYDDVINKYVTPLWYIVGFPGNFLAFLVWIQPKMRQSSGYYLAALSMTDFVFLILQLNAELNGAWEQRVLSFPVWCELFPIIFFTTQYLSPLFVLGFTVERYISICHPYKRDKYCTTKRAIVVIVSLIIFSLSMHSIQGYFWRFDDTECNVRVEVLEGETRSLWAIWAWVTELLTFAAVPLTILTLNILVIIETGRMTKRQPQYTLQGSNSKPSNQSATTIMLLAVSFYLIASTLPVTICYSIVHSFPDGDPCLPVEQVEFDPQWQRCLSYWSTRTVIQELGMSHYACNFYIYLLTGRMFRVELQQLLNRIFCKDWVRRLLRTDGFEFHKSSHSEATAYATNISMTETSPLK